VALDVQVVRGIAPEAQIINYEGPKTGAGIAALMARIVADGRADIVSISWGGCEKLLGNENMRAIDREFEAAFAAGISVFVASGDNGAYGCRRFPVSANPLDRDNAASASYPASSPNVISVGGTFLTTLADGTYVSEAGWEEPLSTAGGGGGLSDLFDRPSWQQGTGVNNSDSNGRRQLPDVAGPSDPASGFFIVYTSPGQGLVSGAIGGTSAAAPMWAASMALAAQLADDAGIDTLGTLHPVLYEIAAEQQPGAVFHDILRGGNLLHDAGPNWDYSTGLGSPRVAQLSQAIVEFLGR
jgi:kumamolisin